MFSVLVVVEPLAHLRSIPLPPSDLALELSRRSSLIEASFRMLQLHDGAGTGLHTVRGHVEQIQSGGVRAVASLPWVQEVDADLLSPLQLTPAPSLRLEDLKEQISHCVDAMDRIHLVRNDCQYIYQREAYDFDRHCHQVLPPSKRKSISCAPP